MQTTGFSQTNDLDLQLYLSEQQTAKMTNRSVSSLQNDRWLNKGIPYHKERKKISYSLSDILAYMELHRIQPTN